MSGKYVRVNIVSTSQAKRKQIEAQTKSLIKTVIERCKKEKDNNQLILPLEEYEERVSYYTGFPKTYIYQLITENKFNEKLISISVYTNILKCLKNSYLGSELASYKNVHQMLQEEIRESISYTDFKQLMALFNFRSLKTSQGFLIVEDPKITFERFHYINKIRKFRSEGRTILYIDERVIDVNFTFPRLNSATDGLVLFHMLSGQGYENGLFCYHPTNEEFMKWIVDIVLTNLEGPCIIVLNDSLFHNINDRVITEYSLKEDMIKWLREHNIPCSNSMRKAELYQLITKCTFYAEKHNLLHSVLKANGHTVLQLPTTLIELSPVEPFWKDLKTKLQSNSTCKNVTGLKTILCDAINSLAPESYTTYEKHIKSYEHYLFSIDEQIETALEKYLTDVNISEIFSTQEFDYVDSD